jgi:hypothetical protein
MPIRCQSHFCFNLIATKINVRLFDYKMMTMYIFPYSSTSIAEPEGSEEGAGAGEGVGDANLGERRLGGGISATSRCMLEGGGPGAGAEMPRWSGSGSGMGRGGGCMPTSRPESTPGAD